MPTAWRLAALIPVLLLLTGAGPPGSIPDPDGLRPIPERRPFRCGTADDRLRLPPPRGPWEPEPPGPRPEAVLDQDVGQTAILFDHGDLVVSAFADTNAIVQQFYETHPDVFDYVAVFMSSAYNFDVQIESGFAFHRRVASDTLGIGIDPVDRAADLGLTTTRLRSILQLNDQLEYLPRFDEPMFQFNGTVEGVEILGQEAGHQFLSFAEIPGEGMLGRSSDHWSFFMSTEASVMEGNLWVEDGNEFVTVDAFETFSQLDEYLMGLRPSAAVTEPMFVIQNPRNTGGLDEASPPEIGVRIRGDRRDVGIAEIIAAEGPRVPDPTVAPHTFTMAWVLVVPSTASPPPGDLVRMERFRRTWVKWFAQETDGLGAIDTALPGVALTADFEIEEFAGPAPLTVRFRDLSLGPITGYLWDLGDGETSTEVDPVHVYTDPGYYTVTLTVDGPGGPRSIVKPFAVVVQPFVEVVADDFETEPSRWIPGPPATASTGHWVHADPVGSSRLGIPVQPEDDTTPDPGSLCWVTGNALPEDPVGTNDIDGGTTTLFSEIYDLSGTVLPVLEYSLWLSNELGGEPGSDLLMVDASPDGGGLWLTVDRTRRGDRIWRRRQVRLTDVFVPTAQVQLRVRVGDEGLQSLVEAALDDVRILALDGASDTDGDALPDAADNCPATSNVDQEDDDQDGRGFACDCDDGDPEATVEAAEPQGVAAHPTDRDRVIWGAAADAEKYNVYRGLLLTADPFAYVQTCFKGHTTALEVADAQVPEPGGFYFYLVSAENGCGETGLGTSSGEAERFLVQVCPPPITPGG